MIDNFEARLQRLKKHAQETQQWVAAGMPVEDEYDTYPIELFQAAASPEMILEMIKRLEEK